MSALAALLRRAGVPWYESMLEEADLGTPGALRAGGAAALAAAGVAGHHADSILREAELEAAPSSKAAPSGEDTASGSGAACAAFTQGVLYSPAFLRVVAPLYEQCMGAENLGPLLHSLVRFTKPRNVLELGAGFTSIFLLQALCDNTAECALAAEAAKTAPSGVPWLTPAFAGGCVHAGTLHCVDNLAHEHTSAHRVQAAAVSLGIAHALRFHDADALDSDASSRLAVASSKGLDDGARFFGLVWIDLGAAHRLRALVDAWWPRVDPAGGMLIVHSTCTNEASRVWLEHMRAAALDDGSGPYGRFELLSLLEPHKCFQNAVTMLRRRGGGPGGAPLWNEPIYSKWP